MRCVVFLCPDLSNLHKYIYYIYCERFSLTAAIKCRILDMNIIRV